MLVIRRGKFAATIFLALVLACDLKSPRHDVASLPNISTSFEMHGGLMVIKADKRVPKSYFVFDTGSAACTLDLKFFPGVTTQPYWDGGYFNLIQSPPHISAGAFDLSKCDTCVSFDMSQISKMVGVETLGLIGYPLVVKNVLQIDYVNEKIRQFPPDNRSHPEWGDRRALYLHDRLWHATFDVNGHQLPLYIDTGSDGFIDIGEDARAEIRKIPGITETRYIRTGFRGREAETRFLANQLTVDCFSYFRVALNGVNYPKSAVGTQFLKNFLVTMDFKRGFLYLRRNIRSSY